MTPNRVIGKDGGIPWHYPEDMKHFRNVTRGHAVIMGRATFDSIGKALPKRRNLIVSRDTSLRIEGCDVVDSLPRAIELARELDEEPRILGGAQIYKLALPLTTRMFLTFIDEDHQGDVLFPVFDRANWEDEETRRGDGLTFMTLVRKP
jgi:dihydrofolate reductase